MELLATVIGVGLFWFAAIDCIDFYFERKEEFVQKFIDTNEDVNA